MEHALPVLVALNSHVSSSAHHYLRATTAKETAQEDEHESDLLKSIRATLRGSRGSSSSFINTVRYAITDESSGLKTSLSNDTNGEEELSWNTYNVVYTVGGVMRKKWGFKEGGQPVQWACIGWFDQPSAITSASSLRPAHYTYEYHEKSTPVADSSSRQTFGPFASAQQEQKRDQEPATRVRAIFIFLRSIGKVYLLNGIDYTFHLPFIVRRSWPMYPHGVMIQRILDPTELEEARVTGDAALPTLFTFLNPFAEPSAVGLTDKLKGGFHQMPPSIEDDESGRPLTSVPAEEFIVWVSQRSPDSTDDIVVTVNTEQKTLSVWRYAFIGPKDIRSASDHPHPAPASLTAKRVSLTGSPLLRRPANLAMSQSEVPVRAAQAGDFPPAGAPSMPSSTPNAAMLSDVTSTEPQRSTHVRGRDSLPRAEASTHAERLMASTKLESDIMIDPVDSGRMQAAYWMERLCSEKISDEDAAALQSISVGLFDQRWDGRENRSLLGVCLIATRSLLIYRIVKHADVMTARPEARTNAVCVASIRATRDLMRDLLLIKTDGTISLLIHGLRELPILFVRPPPHSDPTVLDVDFLTPTLPERIPVVNMAISVSAAVDSTATIVFADRTQARVTMDLMPKDHLTRQCLLMLALIMPSEHFYVFHSRFLRLWSMYGLDLSESSAFTAFTTAFYEAFAIQQDSPSTTNAEAWQSISGTTSSLRFREDPVLRKLKLPPPPPPASTARGLVGRPHSLLAPILLGLHYIGEDLRLMIHRYRDLLQLVPVICRIAVLVRPEWADYWKRLCPDALEHWPSPSEAVLQHADERIPVWPPDVSAILYGRINNPEWNVPLIESSKIAQSFKIGASFAYGHAEPLMYLRQFSDVYAALADNTVTDCRKRAEDALQVMVKTQIGSEVLRWLPLGIAAPLREACRTCQLSPSGTWSVNAYYLIGRHDLAEVLSPYSETAQSRGYRPVKDFILPSGPRKSIREHIYSTRRAITGELNVVSGVELDLDDFTQIRFGQDRRLEEVARMLCSSNVPTIKAVDRPELSDHDQAKEHQHQVIRLAERTLALPLGRALFTFGSVPTVTREAFAIPKIEFAVRLQPMNNVITPEPGKIPLECISWGEFHNGVAAGLRISSQSNAVESTWIKFNRPSELTPEHAGFLYALGLTGHLREMLTWHTFGYLTPKHDMTSIGVLLGLSAANSGTGNRHVTKLLAVHTPALLPTPNVDLNVPLITQAAGLMGIGLLYMGTKNRRMAEVCLSQISRKDLYQPDLSNEYREAYTLSAALACGMVMLGKGSSIPADLAFLSRLRILIHGEGHSQGTEKLTRPSFDLNLTSPAATVTLGLMYLRTNRQDVADILAIPDTVLGLNGVQPQFLMLRAISRALIMWDSIAPTRDWLVSQLPPGILAAVTSKLGGKTEDDAFDLAYYNILSGLLFAMALKFAGTAREEAYLLIIQHYDMFSQVAYANGPAFDVRIKRAAIRDGLNLISIALNMVMAGTGEINCLRRLRYAYGMYNQPIRYGTHLATHMSLGLLFLGGGRFTLGTSDAAIACMVAAFFPKFVHVSSDNKSYLQAFRHLWVLAVEPRCLIARDVDTKEVVYLPVKIKVKEGSNVGTNQLISPTLIPDLDKLLSIRVDTPRYWPFYLDIANIARHKDSLLRSQTLFVKRRTAFLSYREDPKGSRSLFVRSGSATGDAATLDFPQLKDIKTHPASDLHHFISSFSNDVLFLAFADRFCREDGETPEERLLHAYCHASLFDSILQDKSQTIQSHLTLYRFRTMSTDSQYFNLRAQDLRFASDFYNKIYDRRFSGRSENNPRPPLIRENTLSGSLLALDRQLEVIRASAAFLPILSRYANGQSIPVYPPGSEEWKAYRDLSWYLQRNSVPVASLLVALKALAQRAHERCLGGSPPEGTSDAAMLDQGIKAVLHATGTQMCTALGSGWSVKSLDEIISAWNAS
ncbi:hypothetical protein WOLCODRAFT_104419 [Wolfiporia cocos MD-104 SS10]|uniref:Uncharacterized protein n=1 Tax=Wolfiporia cocos (strain MD-104) TaxID=742152 RepID=A0A2H3K1D3_WOLCO|nr:hypothetical protein WOLCODRAFT_104419 [Wolfiporia cocos MD-104 SS10]